MNQEEGVLISNFCHVLYVVCFLLGNSPVSECYMPTFWNTLSVPFYTYLPMKMEQTECSETSAYKIQTPGNYPEESIQEGIYCRALSQHSSAGTATNHQGRKYSRYCSMVLMFQRGYYLLPS